MNIEQLKRTIGALLHNSNIKPTTVKGRSMIHAFWAGAMAQHGIETAPPFITIYLMCGRHEELVTLPGSTS